MLSLHFYVSPCHFYIKIMFIWDYVTVSISIILAFKAKKTQNFEESAICILSLEMFLTLLMTYVLLQIWTIKTYF